jgi:hypothetical protein
MRKDFSALKCLGTVPDCFNAVKYRGTVPQCIKGIKFVENNLSFLLIFCIFELLGSVFCLNMENGSVSRQKTRSKVLFVDFTCGNGRDMIETSNGEE